jgi:flagellar biogenesis protein FliO
MPAAARAGRRRRARQCLGVLLLLPPLAAWGAGANAGVAIPYRQEQASFASQAAYSFGLTILILAIVAAVLYFLRKRTALRIPGFAPVRKNLRIIESVRVAPRTMVHVVVYRNRKIVFAQSGESLVKLTEFDEPGAEPGRAAGEVGHA